MKSSDDIVLEALLFLAQTREKLSGFSRHLSWGRESSSIVTNVLSNVDVRQQDMAFDIEGSRHESGLAIEIWLEAELRDGPKKALTWWVDILPLRAGWLVEGKVFWNVADNQEIAQEPIAEFPQRMLADFHRVQQETDSLLEEMFSIGSQALKSLGS